MSDWWCPKCKTNIFGKKPRCLICNCKKGDWECRHCKFIVFSTKNVCKCGYKKYTSEIDYLRQQEQLLRNKTGYSEIKMLLEIEEQKILEHQRFLEEQQELYRKKEEEHQLKMATDPEYVENYEYKCRHGYRIRTGQCCFKCS